MLSEDRFFQSKDKSRIWQRYCGFLDITVEEFMRIQEGLLLEQIDLVYDSPLGKRMMGEQKPASLEEFRRAVPLTDYNDYVAYIGDRQEDSLAVKPYYWVHTSFIEGTYKRVPWCERFAQTQLRNIIASLILSAASSKGEVHLIPGSRIFAVLPERPFATAQMAFDLVKKLTVKAVIPLEEAEQLPFTKKIETTLETARFTDLDYMIVMSSSFLPIERGFRKSLKGKSLLSLIFRMHPRVSWRLIRNRLGKVFRSDKTVLPRDFWSIKGIVVWGADSGTLQHVINKQWGKRVFQLYGSSESAYIAMQDWRKDAMNFLPDSVFLEFLPDGSEENSTVLINELEEGKLYEPVITSFYGMPLLRYRQGDLVRILPRQDGEKDKPLQMSFHSRADDVIDLYGIARINTRAISQGLELTGISFGQWSMRKEQQGDKPVLALYIELDSEKDAPALERLLHRNMKRVDIHYREAIYVVGYNPLRVISLSRGAFDSYLQKCRNNGHNADLANLPRMNPSDAAVEGLLQLRGR